MSAAKSPDPACLHDRRSIERLTIQALEAARAGDWDQVDACYSARGLSLASCALDRPFAQQLLRVDEEVRSAILVAQAAISGQLADAAQVKRHLRQLRESSGQLASERVTIHREA
jgi:phage shock protein A